MLPGSLRMLNMKNKEEITKQIEIMFLLMSTMIDENIRININSNMI